MKIYKTISGKISLGIILTTLVIISFISIYNISEINAGFDEFLNKQDIAFENIGLERRGRFLNDPVRIREYDRIITDFKKTISNSIILASGIGFISSFVVGQLIAKQIVSPLKRLKHHINKITTNKYHKIKIDNASEEIEELAIAFNKLVDELNRVEKLREDLVSDVTHELNTPLTRLKGKIEGMLDGIYKSDEKQLKRLLSNTSQLEYLVSQLQRLTDIRSGKIQLNKKELNLFNIAQGILDDISISKPVTLVNKIPKDYKLVADIARVQEIITNLINNAVRHTKKGKITLKILKDKLIIKDTGEGIAKKDLPYIFERFYRADKSRNTKTGGLGLGLAIVKELVEIHGWEISVKSKVGEGTVFTIVFYTSP